MSSPRKTDLFERLLIRRMPFLAVFFGMFFLTYGILFAIDFIPEAPKQDTITVAITTPKVTDTAVISEVVDAYPNRMIIDVLNKDVVIQNPKSRAVADLDDALLSGAVRHPDSADFVQKGTIFLFGHSSYLPHVFNKNFQAFNDIQKLVWGDTIRLHSSDTEYRYEVRKVYKTKASDATIALERGTAKLTLVTCNSFCSKDERFVVEAELVDTKPL
jgi:LPXTG-site transpeptidase (sortase) family protein